MSKILIIILWISILSCYEKKQQVSPVSKDTVQLQPASIVENVNKTILERFISVYVDSINIAITESDLPAFLTDPQFDYKHKGFWKTSHNPISIRAQIIKRINTCKSLELILTSAKAQYRVKPVMEEDLRPPFIEASIYELAEMQHKWLDCSLP